MNNPFKRKPKQPKNNVLHIGPRRITADNIPEPVGGWFTAGGRTMSMTETSADGDVVAWTPTQNSISAKMLIFTPTDLYDLLHWEKPLRAVYWTPSDIWRKLNMGLMFGLIALLLFFAYLIYSNQTGGGA